MSLEDDKLVMQIRAAKDRASQALSVAESKNLNDEWIQSLYEWTSYLRMVRNLSVSTAANYLRWVTDWLVYLKRNDLEVGESKSSNVITWQRDLVLVYNLAANTRGMALTAVRQYYDWRELQNFKINSKFPTNPARSVKGPKRGKRQPRKFSDDQLSKLFRAQDIKKTIGIRDRAMLLFFYSTGARREEMTELSLHQLVLKTNTGAVRFLGKGNKERTLSFEGPVVKALYDWLAVRDALGVVDHDAVFVGITSRGKGRRLSVTGINAIINRNCKLAGIKKHPDDPFGVHRLRSSFATDLYDAGKDIRAIQLLLGHDDINQTMTYIAITNRQMQERMPASRVNELLGNKSEVPGYVQQKVNR